MNNIVVSLLYLGRAVHDITTQSLKHLEITAPQLWLLDVLHQAKKPISSSELAEQMKVSTSNITAMGDRMVKNGLIERVFSDNDRRKILIQISNDGIKKHAKGMKVLDDLSCSLNEQMGETFEPAVKKLINKLEETGA